jgi:hypothetical protein
MANVHRTAADERKFHEDVERRIKLNGWTLKDWEFLCDRPPWTAAGDE